MCIRDSAKVGALQGQALADCLGEKDANIIYLNGSPTDNNATLFAAGAHEILDPITSYKVVGEQAVPDWDNEQAAVIFQQLYTAADGKVDGVLAANDGLGAPRSASSRPTARPARSRSRVRTPPSRVCRTSSPAPSA